MCEGDKTWLLIEELAPPKLDGVPLERVASASKTGWVLAHVLHTIHVQSHTATILETLPTFP